MMHSALRVLCVAALALAAAPLQRTLALSAALYLGYNNNPYCDATQVVESATSLGSGSCFAVGGYGARITCTADGHVSQAALFNGPGCDIVFISGSGVGDGVSCITLSSPHTSVVWSTIIDCSAPGPASSGLSAGAIAGIVIAGVVLLAAGAWFCWRKHAQTQSTTLQNSMMLNPMHTGEPASTLPYYQPPQARQTHPQPQQHGQLRV